MTETADRIAVSLVTDPAWTDNGHYVAQALWTSAAKVATAHAQVAELCPTPVGRSASGLSVCRQHSVRFAASHGDPRSPREVSSA